jgi:phosphoribosyl 1,2-cyclic phosphate phosphodiesterase
MQITLLGTGAADGCPGLFCACPTCQKIRTRGGRDLRTRSSALLDNTLLIDLSPDLLTQARLPNVSLLHINHILLTHGHDDHFTPAHLQYLSWMFVEKPRTAPIHIWGPPDTIAALCSQFAASQLPLQMHTITTHSPVNIGTTTVTAIPAHHAEDRTCHNYILRTTTGSLLYATDTGWYPETTWRLLQNAKLDIVIVECTRGAEEDGYAGHLNARQTAEFAHRLHQIQALNPNAQIVTTHHSHRGGMLHEELTAWLRPHGVTVGYDGLTLTTTQNLPQNNL